MWEICKYLPQSFTVWVLYHFGIVLNKPSGTNKCSMLFISFSFWSNSWFAFIHLNYRIANFTWFQILRERYLWHSKFYTSCVREAEYNCRTFYLCCIKFHKRSYHNSILIHQRYFDFLDEIHQNKTLAELFFLFVLSSPLLYLCVFWPIVRFFPGFYFL